MFKYDWGVGKVSSGLVKRYTNILFIGVWKYKQKYLQQWFSVLMLALRSSAGNSFMFLCIDLRTFSFIQPRIQKIMVKNFCEENNALRRNFPGIGWQSLNVKYFWIFLKFSKHGKSRGIGCYTKQFVTAALLALFVIFCGARSCRWLKI